jgi:ribonuclease HI
MNSLKPRYLLTTETGGPRCIGGWKFVLRPIDGSAPIEVADVEPGVWGERLDLLTVVRALESLDQSSHVTVVRCTHYVQQGIQFGMNEWRENGWQWEWFGQMAPVRDADLWQRMDRILQFHQVECGFRRIDPMHDTLPCPHHDGVSIGETWAERIAGTDWVKYNSRRLATWCKAQLETAALFWKKFFGVGLGARG